MNRSEQSFTSLGSDARCSSWGIWLCSHYCHNSPGNLIELSPLYFRWRWMQYIQPMFTLLP